jgi:hypothetical protein
MILTLAWKEVREHQAIWLTMLVMTVVLGWGLPRLVAAGDPAGTAAVAALTILGMAAANGVVCGSMMFAGEHEGGTLVFLDIFLGCRGLLWFGKFAIGIVLVLAQAVAVALALLLLKQQPPDWIMALVGIDARHPDSRAWLLILPVVSLEAYALGLLGSSFTQRVLSGAALAALGVTPILLMAIMAPPLVFYTLQVVIGCIVLPISYLNFVAQSREPTLGTAPEFEGPVNSKEQFLDLWEEFEQEDDTFGEAPASDAPATIPAISPTRPAGSRAGDPTPPVPESGRGSPAHAASANEVLWWLTLNQAWLLLLILAGAALLIGMITPANTQVLWPLATLLLGVACGTAAFAPEQRDLSYQFLSAQHLPLKTIWRFKVLFWLAVAVAGALLIVFGHFLNIVLRRRPNDAFEGTLPELMGPTLFFGVWLVYGFCTGQVFVWVCRKSILALLVSFLVAGCAIGLWLPSVLCGGMTGWQLWVPPLTMLLATWSLMRAWASGRIKERKPLAALVGFGLATIVWALVNFGYRAWEIPQVGEPIDPEAFRATLPFGKENAAAKAIQQAIGQLDEANDLWLASMAEASRLPTGVLEMPRADGQLPLLKHLPGCQKMTEELLKKARAKAPGPAFEHLAQILALSRNLRNKAPVESYLAGVQAEEDALNGLDQWLARGKPAPKLLRRVLDELNRHAEETPPPLSCLQAECFRSGGMLANPSDWTLQMPGGAGKIPERWLAGSITLSLEMPWETARNTRIWQLVWAGLFRAVETPHWQRPEPAEELRTDKTATRKILQGWLPAPDGPSAAVTRAHVIRLVDASWLSDDRLFCSVAPLHDAAIRARWRVDATRQTIALSLYRLDEGKSAQALQQLVPKYLPTRLPTDPYSGQSFRYRIEPENDKGIVWSTGPDRIDHGGRKHGGHLRDDDAQWSRGDLDLIMAVPQWP